MATRLGLGGSYIKVKRLFGRIFIGVVLGSSSLSSTKFFGI